MNSSIEKFAKKKRTSGTMRSRGWDYGAQALPLIGPLAVGGMRGESSGTGVSRAAKGAIADALGSGMGGLAGAGIGGTLATLIGMAVLRGRTKGVSGFRQVRNALRKQPAIRERIRKSIGRERKFSKLFPDMHEYQRSGGDMMSALNRERGLLGSPESMGLAGAIGGGSAGGLIGGAEALRAATLPDKRGEDYAQGFIAKCTECGIDSAILAKQALSAPLLFRAATAARGAAAPMLRAGQLPLEQRLMEAAAKRVAANPVPNLSALYGELKSMPAAVQQKYAPQLEAGVAQALEAMGRDGSQAGEVMQAMRSAARLSGASRTGFKPNFLLEGGAGAGQYVRGFAPSVSPSLRGVVGPARTFAVDATGAAQRIPNVMAKAPGFWGRGMQLATGSRGRALDEAAGKVIGAATPADLAAQRAQSMFAGLRTQSADEANKVLATRLVLGGAGALGVYNLTGMGKAKQQKYDWTV